MITEYTSLADEIRKSAPITKKPTLAAYDKGVIDAINMVCGLIQKRIDEIELEVEEHRAAGMDWLNDVEVPF